MVKVKFTTFGANSAFGSFAPGDTLRCSPEMAKHLVNEVRCAVYVGGLVETQPSEAVPTPRKRKDSK